MWQPRFTHGVTVSATSELASDRVVSRAERLTTDPVTDIHGKSWTVTHDQGGRWPKVAALPAAEFVPRRLRGTPNATDDVLSSLLDPSLGVLDLAFCFPVCVAGDLAFELLRRADELIFLPTHIWSSIAGQPLAAAHEGCPIRVK